MPKTKSKKSEIAVNREHWLNEIAAKLIPEIEKVTGKKTPPFLISTGFPSRNALSIKRRTIGQCWDGMVSEDGRSQLFISPVLGDPMEIAATVGHELVHANIGTKYKHNSREFIRAVRGIGLEGKPTATYAGGKFIEIVGPMLEGMPEYPHSKLVASTLKKPQATRLLKVSCAQCGYIARVTAKWLNDAGSPLCPVHKAPMDAE